MRTIDDSADHAFVFMDDVMYDLNALTNDITELGWTIIGAQGINDTGQIVANGVRNGLTHALLLSPVPEPATAIMVLAVLVLWRCSAVRSASPRQKN